MSIKWTGSQSESGILRKSEFKEKKEELFVFGYSCKLFRDDDKAQLIDQGKHLIPWMGDETLKIDRYDARGALHDLTSLEAPPGGYDWRVELKKTEQDVELLCDDERYRALHTDEDEEEMYKEEELKRLHAAGYGQVGFNYDTPSEPEPISQPVEVDEPFVPTPAFRALLPVDIVLPESQKQNAIIEKTATFIATQGAQMEILIKAKQGNNPQFKFLNRESELHAYYMALIGLIKADKWPEKKVEIPEVEDTHPENDYLHPSLASTVIESAPSIPSIHYKPSADCDYALLICKMRGEETLDEAYTELAPGEVAPPGTEPLPPRRHAEISRAPVMYHRTTPKNQTTATSSLAAQYQQYVEYYQQFTYFGRTQSTLQPMMTTPPVEPCTMVPASKSTGLSLMKNYNTDSDSDSNIGDTSSSEGKDKLVIPTPPPEVHNVIDKMAAYVARNGDEFAEIVRTKNDPRFTFLEPTNEYYAYYMKLMREKRGVDVNGKEDVKSNKTPVSFSIKKHKEPESILPKPALPYETSSDEDSEKIDKQTDKQTENQEIKDTPKINIPQFDVMNNIPQVIYKIEQSGSNDIPIVKNIDTALKIIPIPPKDVLQPAVEATQPVVKEKTPPIQEIKPKPEVEAMKEISATPDEKKTTEKSKERLKESLERKEPDKRKYREEKHQKKEYKSKSESKDSRRIERSTEGDKKKEKKKKHKDELENEVISLVDNSDDLIDLTGDQSDCKEMESETERAKQAERRRRATEFLRKVGVDPGTVPLPTSSLACAMVETLETLQKKKVEEEESRRKRDKRRYRDRRGYEIESERSHRKRKKNKTSDDNEDTDHESSKKKKRKKDKKHSSKGKKKKRRETEAEEDPIPLNIDLINTLKELRTSSPTKELGLQNLEETQHSSDESGGVGRKKWKKDEREYSEGEWSSDSDEDSMSSDSKED